MSKYVKNIISSDLQKRLKGVDNALLVNLVGMTVNNNNKLRKELASKGINLLVVKNSMADRATKETSLNPMFNGLTGSSAICWGASDIVSLAKEIIKISKDKAYSKFEIRGGVLDGEAFQAETVLEISKWPTREEQISILLGQIVGVGSKLSSQLLSGGANLASQFKQIWDQEEETENAESNETAA
ncbi:MAG: 50S ribosomal protein L10 [Planctomycetia bacterium]|nr:50S ribosomal protein L10 [Planctomycetia bacterium]